MSKLFENAGPRRGGATKTAKDYWDRALSLEVHSISESGRIAFVGKSVQQIVESKVKTARNKKELFG